MINAERNSSLSFIMDRTTYSREERTLGIILTLTVATATTATTATT